MCEKCVRSCGICCKNYSGLGTARKCNGGSTGNCPTLKWSPKIAKNEKQYKQYWYRWFCTCRCLFPFFGSWSIRLGYNRSAEECIYNNSIKIRPQNLDQASASISWSKFSHKISTKSQLQNLDQTLAIISLWVRKLLWQWWDSGPIITFINIL